MKHPEPNESPKKNPALNPVHYGFNIIYVDEVDADAPLVLRKPVENFSNLSVRVIDKTKTNLFSAIDGLLNLARFRELKSLRFEHVSFLDCDKNESEEKVEKALAPLSKLRSLTLDSVFKNTDAKVDVNAAVQSFFRAGIKTFNQLEEFQFHNNDVSQWNDETWAAFAEAIRSVKRFSFKSSYELSKDNFNRLCNILKNCKELVSCEIKVPNFVKSSDFINFLSKTPLSVLEISCFDFTKAEDVAFFEKVLVACPDLQTLGLKVKAWDSHISGRVFDVLATKAKLLSQLIIDSEDVRYNIDSLRRDLALTNIIDVRFINSAANSDPAKCPPVDYTPLDVMKLCTEIIDGIYEANESDPKKIEALISRLCLDKSSVPVLGHHINAMMQNYFDLMRLDKSKRDEFTLFVAKFAEWIESGRLSYAYVAKLFGDSWDPSQHNELLTLLPSAMKNFDGVEAIHHYLGPRFLEIVQKRVFDLRPKVIALKDPAVKAETADIENLLVECVVLESLINDNKYFSLMNDVERYDSLLALHYFNDILSHRLGQKTQNVEDFIRQHSEKLANATDPHVFSRWFVCSISIIQAVKSRDEVFANKLLHLVFVHIKNSDLLQQANLSLNHLRRMHSSIAEQLFLFRLSLACLRRAMQNGYDDKENPFPVYLEDYMAITGKNVVESEGEIDILVKQLFVGEAQAVKLESPKVEASKPEPAKEVVLDDKVDSAKTTLKDAVNKESGEVKRVPLKDLLKAKKEGDATGAKRVPLKDLLKAKKEEDSSQSGKFFADQSRDGAVESKGVGEGNTLN